jgi:hypothetical protein
MLTTASLSPAPIFAFSRISFGSTIWPLSSTLTIDSTLQQLIISDAQQGPFLPTDVTNKPQATTVASEYLIFSDKSEYADIRERELLRFDQRKQAK